MVIGVSIFELHLPYARSLKHKRKVVKGLVERAHQRLRISIAETDFHDLHQRTEITFAVVAQNEGEAERMIDKVRTLVDEQHDGVVTAWDPQILEMRA